MVASGRSNRYPEDYNLDPFDKRQSRRSVDNSWCISWRQPSHYSHNGFDPGYRAGIWPPCSDVSIHLSAVSWALESHMPSTIFWAEILSSELLDPRHLALSQFS